MRAVASVIGALLLLQASTASQGLLPDSLRGPDTVDHAVVTGDSLIGSTENGNGVQRFIGNVHGSQDSTYFWSDRALRLVEQDLIQLAGRVLIVDGTDSLNADTVMYEEQTKVGEAFGNVRLSDGDIVAHAPTGTYFTQEKKADFLAGITLVDSSATIDASTGTYYTEERRAEMAGGVRLLAKRSQMEADSLTYLRDAEWSNARGNVSIRRMGAASDSLDTTYIIGHSVVGTEGLSAVRGFPLVVQFRQDSTGVDTLITRAQRVDMVDTDSVHLLTSAGNAQFWRSDVAAVADSMSYRRKAGSDREEVWLVGTPRLWVDRTQVTGDTIHMVLIEQDMDSLRVLGNVFLATQDSVSGRIHQVRGKQLMSAPTNDSTRTYTVRNNAEIVYYRTNEQEELDGAIHITGDEAILTVRSGEATLLRFIGEHRGTVYPEEAMPASLDLEGFSWVPELRPLGDQLLDGKVLLKEEK